MNNGTINVNLSSDCAYKILINSLKANHIIWFSYINKQNSNSKVMIKNLHHSYEPINILHSLEDQGFQTLNATLKLKWKTEEPLDMFSISFHLNTNINKISNIKTICRTAVTDESIRSNKLISQCKICQSFGHTRNYCNKAPTYAKCAGPHLRSECGKPLRARPKYFNCGKNHPANHRGCEVIKELQNFEVTRINQNNKRRKIN
jgi:hypothetical protein